MPSADHGLVFSLGCWPKSRDKSSTPNSNVTLFGLVAVHCV